MGWDENVKRAQEKATKIRCAVNPLVKCSLTDTELIVILLLKEHDWVPSSTLKELFGIEGRKPALTKSNFPNIRHKLHSFMNATHRGMYRGGWAWFSAIEWKEGLSDFKDFISTNGI